MEQGRVEAVVGDRGLLVVQSGYWVDELCVRAGEVAVGAGAHGAAPVAHLGGCAADLGEERRAPGYLYTLVFREERDIVPDDSRSTLGWD